MITGPIKCQAVDMIRREIKRLLPHKHKTPKELMYNTNYEGMLNLDLLDKVKDEKWVNKILNEDAVAWEEAQKGSWGILIFGVCLPPLPENIVREGCLDSFMDINYSTQPTIKAADKYGVFPVTCPEEVIIVGTHKGNKAVYAAATCVDGWNQVHGNIWFHESDPDAALWAAIQEFESKR